MAKRDLYKNCLDSKRNSNTGKHGSREEYNRHQKECKELIHQQELKKLESKYSEEERKRFEARIKLLEIGEKSEKEREERVVNIIKNALNFSDYDIAEIGKMCSDPSAIDEKTKNKVRIAKQKGTDGLVMLLSTLLRGEHGCKIFGIEEDVKKFINSI